MKVPFWGYLLWYCLKNLAIAVTIPIWFPIALLIVLVMGVIVWVVEVYEAVKRDWKRKYGDRNESS